jgi:hypothetical protein
MRVTLLCLVFFALLSLGAVSQDHPLTFTAEVSAGKTFRRSIGHGLDLVLVPDSTEGSISGWTIEVSPQIKASNPECTDFLGVVTPPLRFGNPRYLDTQYGLLAQEAVARSPREFSFVLNCSDFETERKRLEIVLWPYSYPQKVVDEAMAKWGSSPLGKGKLWIEDSRITPGMETADGSNPGVIHWIRFKVEITFPARPPTSPK